MAKSVFLDRMMCLLIVQSCVAFFYAAIVVDILVRTSYTTLEIVGVSILIAYNFSHAGWVIFRFPRFHPHTDHTRQVTQLHPLAHPDYLHPEHAASFKERVLNFHIRREREQLKRDDATVTDVILQSLSPQRMQETASSQQQQPRAYDPHRPSGWNPFNDSIRILPLPPPSAIDEKKDATTWQPPNVVMEDDDVDNNNNNNNNNNNVRRTNDKGTWGKNDEKEDAEKSSGPTLFTTMTHADVKHMDTNTCCCCISIPVQSLTEDEEMRWISQYVRVNFVLLLLGMMIDVMINYRAKSPVIWSLVLAANSARLIGLYVCDEGEFEGAEPPRPPPTPPIGAKNGALARPPMYVYVLFGYMGLVLVLCGAIVSVLTAEVGTVTLFAIATLVVTRTLHERIVIVWPLIALFVVISLNVVHPQSWFTLAWAIVSAISFIF